MKVTALAPEPSGSGVRIRLDGEPFVTVSADDIVTHGIRVGKEIDAATHAELSRLAEVFAARKVAMRLLGIRAFASGELARRLAQRGHAQWAISAAVAELVRLGLIDDEEFARHFVRTRSRNKRLGPARLRADLRRRGVADAVIERALADALELDGVDSRQLLREAAFRKAASLRGLDPERAHRRLRAYLQRRGFSGSDVTAVVKEALAG
ncbi:MAG TPA: regulatory protein RecX [Gemmatimonadales bacterium]|nr:regulatory protein RecX [Gemmatimonadales bacterium]